MILLTSTSDIIRVVTGSAAAVDVHASWVDNLSDVITPGRTNTAQITTATTTTVLGSPAASTQRAVKHLNITNTHATVSTTVLVEHFDGTTGEDLMGVTLLPGENLVLSETGDWKHHDAQGALYNYVVPPAGNVGLTGTIAETMPRQTCPEVNTTMGASGVLDMHGIYLPAGALVSNITLWSATTAAGTPTNYFFLLYDASRNLLAQSANQTTTAWAANTQKTLAMTTPYRVTVSGFYYIGYYMTATTVPTIKGGTAKTGAQLAGGTPILHGSSSTGLTTTPPNPAAAITAQTRSFYAAVS